MHKVTQNCMNPSKMLIYREIVGKEGSCWWLQWGKLQVLPQNCFVKIGSNGSYTPTGKRCGTWQGEEDQHCWQQELGKTHWQKEQLGLCSLPSASHKMPPSIIVKHLWFHVYTHTWAGTGSFFNYPINWGRKKKINTPWMGLVFVYIITVLLPRIFMSGRREALQKLSDFTDRRRRKVPQHWASCHYIPWSQPSKRKCNSKGVAWSIHCIFLGFIYSYTAKIIRKIFLWHFLTFSLEK